MYRLVSRLIDLVPRFAGGKGSEKWDTRLIANLKKQAEEGRTTKRLNSLKKGALFLSPITSGWWSASRKGKLRDVEGLVKLVDRKELKENDWV